MPLSLFLSGDLCGESIDGRLDLSRQLCEMSNSEQTSVRKGNIKALPDSFLLGGR